MTKTLAVALAVLAGAGLAACDRKDDQPQTKGGPIASEILERSVSDDMIPYDTLRSQPPFASVDPAEGQDDTESAAASGPGEAQVPATTRSPAATGSPKPAETVRPDAE